MLTGSLLYIDSSAFVVVTEVTSHVRYEDEFGGSRAKGDILILMLSIGTSSTIQSTTHSLLTYDLDFVFTVPFRFRLKKLRARARETSSKRYAKMYSSYVIHRKIYLYPNVQLVYV